LSDLSPEMYFMSEGLKEKLTMPLILQQNLISATKYYQFAQLPYL
jgi:hypothetical protein